MNLKRALCKVAILGSIVSITGTTPAIGSPVSTTYYLDQTEEATLYECMDYTYNLSYDDDYFYVRIDSPPQITAPTDYLKIEVYFSQSCTSNKDWYQRSLSLIRPDGTLLPLVKHPTMSWSSESRFSIYCKWTSCWGHNDVYFLRNGSTAQSGDYGLRFTTNFRLTSCNTVSGATVCENNPVEKTFDLPKLFNLVQSGVPAAWEITESPSVAAPVVRELGKVTLTAFSNNSSKLSLAQKNVVGGLLNGYPETTEAVCTGLHLRTATKSQKALILKRAASVCEHAKSYRPDLKTSTSLKQIAGKSLSGRVLISVRG